MALPEVKLKASSSSFICFLLLTIAVFTSSCDAFFRNMMISDTAMARIDPIVDRGEASAHVHHLNGAGNLGFDSTGATLSGSNCTNSIITQDKSAYWAPWLYFEHDDGTLQDVKLALGLTAYYKYETRGLAGPDVDYRVFPKGLNMLAGNSSNREWRGPWPVPATSFWGPDDTTQEALAAKAMGFNCMNYEPGKNEPSFAYPWLRSKEYLDQNCINGIRAEIIFPSCWDGQNLDSDDHKSHMAYPPFIQDGICPDTHPVYLPILFYETIWQTNAFANVPGRFVFSNGDPTGYGYHADFIASWDDGVQEAVKANTLCTSLASDGEVESCPVFDGKVQSQADAQACKLVLPEAIANEQVDGSLERLPGNVNITGIRHDPGSPPSAGSEPYAPSTSLGASQSSVIASNQAASTGYYRPPVTSGAYPNSVSPSDQAAASITASPISDAPALATGSSITTTYTSGHYVVEMVLIEMTETVTATTAPTLTQTVVINGTRPTDGPAIKARHHRHARNHVHKHHHNGHF